MISEVISYDRLRPNGWNPNEMNELQFAAEVESIETFGFIDPVTVRETPVDEQARDREIVDGEHRFEAFALVRAKWQRGEFVPLEDAAPNLLPYLEQNALPVSNLGQVSEVNAKRLTLILNETRGRALPVDVATLLAEIAAETSTEEARIGLPYSDKETEDLLKMVEYDWEQAQQQGSGGQGGSEAGDSQPVEPFVTITVLLPESAHIVWLEAVEKVKRRLGQEVLQLNKDTSIANGQVLEALSAEYLASP